MKSTGDTFYFIKATPIWFKVVLGMHALALLVILVWYFFLDGFLGYGYGELVYMGLMLVALVAVLVLLFIRLDRVLMWMICAGIVLMDYFIVQVFENVLR